MKSLRRLSSPRLPPLGFSSLLILCLATAVNAREKPGPPAPSAETFKLLRSKLPTMAPELPKGYLFEGKDYSAEFVPEGVIWKWHPGENQFAFWVVEIRGTRGQIFWTRYKKHLDFGIDNDRVMYKRTLLIRELYEGSHEGITQIWEFADNPLWEGGDLLITGEILTSLEVRKVEGKIQFFDREGGWVGSFFDIEAQDRSGRELTLEAKLDGKMVTLAVPAAWLYEANSVRLGRK